MSAEDSRNRRPGKTPWASRDSAADAQAAIRFAPVRITRSGACDLRATHLTRGPRDIQVGLDRIGYVSDMDGTC